MGAVTVKFLARGMEITRASAVPILAIDICIPMASAISFPLNHLTTAFEIIDSASQKVNNKEEEHYKLDKPEQAA